jgi:hypothetical protein
MDQQQLDNLQASYDRVAEEYARRIFDELQYKPPDRQLLIAWRPVCLRAASSAMWAAGRDTWRVICTSAARG